MLVIATSCMAYPIVTSSSINETASIDADNVHVEDGASLQISSS